MARETAAREGRSLTIRREDCLHLIAGTKNPKLVSLFVSADDMTAGTIELGVGKTTDSEEHPGDEAICHAGRAQRVPSRYV